MKAQKLIDRRIVITEDAFAEIVVHGVDPPKRGSAHAYKYRMAYIVRGVCVLRFDNEDGKGDHLHRGGKEWPYMFRTIDQLLDDFQLEIDRWDNENRGS